MATVRQMKKNVRSAKGSTVLTRRDVKQMIESVVAPEIKDVTVAYTGTTAAAGVVLSITDVLAQGNDIVQRAGDTIRVKLLRTTLRLVSGANPTFVRMVIFHDRFCVGTAPTVLNVLNSASSGSHYAPVFEQAKRFTILSDRIFKMASATDLQLATSKQNFNMDKVIHYNATTAAAPGANSIFVILIADAVASFPTYSFDFSFRYADN